MTPVVIDASAGVEILANTAHGRRLARLLPPDAVGWVPEHFYVEVAGFRHNMTMADAVYVALAAELGGALLTDDHRLVNSPGFPTNVSALTLERS